MIVKNDDRDRQASGMDIESRERAVTSDTQPIYMSDCGLFNQFIKHLEKEASHGAEISVVLEGYAQTARQPPPNPSSLKTDTPFLSIVTRTQGQRPDTLREAFLTLSGQSCQDFEVILVGHKLDTPGEALVRNIVSDQPSWLRSRIRFIRVDHGNRTTPLNIGFQESAGRYTAILDDDDFVFANWVEVFKNLELANPGRVLRAMSVLQDFEEVETQFGTKCSRAVSSPRSIYPLTFQLLDHLRGNYSPPVALAFPRYFFSSLGGRFDETLTTTEDWDYLMRAAFVCGVASAAVVTSIYRQWISRENSRTIHPPQEWIDNHHRIFEKHDNSPLLLEAGTTKILRQILDERDQLRAWAKRLDEELRSFQSPTPPAEIARLIHEPEPNMPENIELYREQVIAILNSTSWKITTVLRTMKQLAKGKRIGPPDISSLNIADLRQLLDALNSSTSWRATASIRRIAPILRKLKKARSDTANNGH